MSIEKEHKTIMIGVYMYMVTKDDIQIMTLLRYQNSKAVYLVPQEAEKYVVQIGTTGDIDNHLKTATQKAKKLEEICKRNYIK